MRQSALSASADCRFTFEKWTSVQAMRYRSAWPPETSALELPGSSGAAAVRPHLGRQSNKADLPKPDIKWVVRRAYNRNSPDVTLPPANGLSRPSTRGLLQRDWSGDRAVFLIQCQFTVMDAGCFLVTACGADLAGVESECQ